jgi:hypothetical protein
LSEYLILGSLVLMAAAVAVPLIAGAVMHKTGGAE